MEIVDLVSYMPLLLVTWLVAWDAVQSEYRIRVRVSGQLQQEDKFRNITQLSSVKIALYVAYNNDSLL